MHPFSYLNVVVNKAVSVNYGLFANCSFPDACERTNRDLIAYFGFRVNDGCGVDFPFVLIFVPREQCGNRIGADYHRERKFYSLRRYYRMENLLKPK